MIKRLPPAGAEPALRRLASLGPLDTWSFDAIEAALAKRQRVRRRRDILAEGKPVAGARLIVSGWAARVRIFADGRRQFLSFLLPGDLIGLCRQPEPLAVSTVTTLTEIEICPAPQSAALETIYATSAALDEAYLLEHITRLGRMSALERIYSLFLEFHERLSRNGLATETGFEMPLTQEMIGDALGLTAVHVNRMLQDARRADILELNAGRVRLFNPAALAEQIGREPVRVTSCLPVNGR
ncbi:Crp/Fnr family transcriptional regulator [Sphingopyxis kveilinensis]|uniref:Crp/Fnr family transcriptional regulator n=1 Tax=Sphingopyxis kveilinensis TaxID=3114367 RepID=UPI0030D07699